MEATLFNGRISAIVPTFNRRDFVVRAVESILNQQPLPDEILVVDDGSTDGTADLLKRRFGDSIRIIAQENSGVSAARRRGVMEAQGDWIAFLDSDDEWTPGRSRILLSGLETLSGDVDWIFGDTVVIEDEHDEISLYTAQGLVLDASPQAFDSNTSIRFPFQYSLLQSSLIRKSTIMDAGCFSESLRSSEDFLVIFRASLGSRFSAISDVVTKLYRTDDLSSSSLDRSEKQSADYFRARVLAFGEAVPVLGVAPWARLHQEAVRGWCLASAAKGQSVRTLSLQQFRHGISPKSVVFSVLAIIGPWAVRLWGRIQKYRNSSEV
jgi:glycosyltransferase involved in cell wall biosynthesis